uniref:Granulins domain-containing protein n=1 Tax=Panagrolaimus superbus TaxID=310955 RepID=A0A914YVY0_9BILA
MNKLFVSATVLLCFHFLFITLSAQDANHVCGESNYQCKAYETCCTFSDGNYGCCPYAYANCCKNVNACCQSGFNCQKNSTGCVRADTNDNPKDFDNGN